MSRHNSLHNSLQFLFAFAINIAIVLTNFISLESLCIQEGSESCSDVALYCQHNSVYRT